MGTLILEASILAGICIYPCLKQCLHCIRRSPSTFQVPPIRTTTWDVCFFYQVSVSSTNPVYIRYGSRLSSSPSLTHPLLAFFFLFLSQPPAAYKLPSLHCAICMYMISHLASCVVRLIISDDQTWQTRFLALRFSYFAPFLRHIVSSTCCWSPRCCKKCSSLATLLCSALLGFALSKNWLLAEDTIV